MRLLFVATADLATVGRDSSRPDGRNHHYAAIYLQLRRQGTPVPANDLWIAALAIQHELVLFSRDPHFQHVAQLARI
jgi:predicted nucleic acid-binding protein